MTPTDRIFKQFRTISFPFSLTSDGVLTPSNNSSGFNYTDISDIDWSRITMEANLTTLSGGTSPTVTIKSITTNDPTNSGGSTSDPLGLEGDGATAFNSGALSATGRTMVAMAKLPATGGTASNIGHYLGLFAHITGSPTGVAGTVTLFLDGQ